MVLSHEKLSADWRWPGRAIDRKTVSKPPTRVQSSDAGFDVKGPKMIIIGKVMRQEDGSYAGSVKTLDMKRPVKVWLVPMKGLKKSEKHPDFKVEVADGAEVGAAWKKRNIKGEYISVTFEEPAFGPLKLYCTLGQSEEEKEAGSEEFDVIWNARTA
jgi:uncharacterized protein (DUF736 family)